jgi:uncharacterized protein GlcG (DUF336 family)
MRNIRSANARIAVDAAMKKALEMQIAVCIAIVDAGGHLLVFLRMDRAMLGSIDISQRKARTSAYFGLNSEVLGHASQPGGPFYGVENSNGGLITFAGGAPLTGGTSEIWGAIGVSGGTSDQDAVIAKSGAEAFST